MSWWPSLFGCLYAPHSCQYQHGTHIHTSQNKRRTYAPRDVVEKWSGSAHIPSVPQNVLEQSVMHASVLAYPNAANPGFPSSTPSQIRANSANATVSRGPGGLPSRPSPSPVELIPRARSCRPEKMV